MSGYQFTHKEINYLPSLYYLVLPIAIIFQDILLQSSHSQIEILPCFWNNASYKVEARIYKSDTNLCILGILGKWQKTYPTI